MANVAPIFYDIQPVLFWIIAILTGGSAIATLLSQNIVRAATWLFFTLGGTAGLFFLLGADFVGAVQLMVYVGGTLVLVIFGVMLTAQSPFISMKTNAAEWALSITVGLALLGVMVVSTFYRPSEKVQKKQQANLSKMTAVKNAVDPKDKILEDDPDKARNIYVLGRGFLGQGVGPAHKNGDKTTRTSYLLPFEIISVHLLVVLIGAAYLARAKRRRGGSK